MDERTAGDGIDYESAADTHDGGSEPEARRLRASSIFAAAALLLVLAWLYPVDWNARAYAGLLAVMLLFAASLRFIFTAAQMLVDEPLSEVVRVLRGQSLAVRTRKRFLTRLQHECDDAALGRRTRTFSLVVIGAVTPDGASAPVDGSGKLQRAVREMVRARDVVATLGRGELWVMALGAGAAAAEALGERLADARGGYRSELAVGAKLCVGWSNHGSDGTDVAELLQAARQRASLPEPNEDEQAAA